MKHVNQIVICIVILLSTTLMAEVPQLISYQGRLTDPANNPVADGSYEITFSIYDVETNGTPFWTETHNSILVQDGLFNTILGATTPFGGTSTPTAALSSSTGLKNASPSMWLGVQVGSDPELTPRSRLLSVLFAFDADRADTAQFAYNSQNATQADTAFYAHNASWSDTAGYSSGALWSDTADFSYSSMMSDTSDYARSVADETINSSSIIDGSIALADLDQNGAADGQIIKWNSSLASWEIVDETVGSGDITAVNAGTGLAGGGTSGDVVLGISNNGVTSTHIQDGTISSQDLSNFGAVDGQMLKWDSALSSWEAVDETGDISSVTAGIGLAGGGTSGDVSLGISGNAIISAMIADNTIIDSDISASANIIPSKISGTAATLSGSNSFTGIQNTFDAPLGIGISSPSVQSKLHVASDSLYAGYFTSNSSLSSTHIIHAEHIGTGDINAVAVYGKSAPADRYGVGGFFEGGLIGVQGEVKPTGSDPLVSYFGIRGLVHGGGAGWSIGVSGSASGSSGTNIGIYGSSFGSGYAGLFSGDVDISGTLSKGAGSFKIDHPLDPANKYLYHSFVESPDMMNVYNGNAILDANGEATVILPDYFGSLNKDFRYQLTCIGGFAPIYIAEKISNNTFRISGGNSGMEVSWQVTGIRKDAYAEANRIQVEVDKPTEDRGLYVHPEAIGLDETKSVYYKHRPKDDKIER